MTADPHLLTGAYACDALADAERRAFEDHLGRCPRCAREIEELRATAASLGAAEAAAPPESLRQRVLARVAVTRQAAATPPSPTSMSSSATSSPAPSTLSPRRRWPRRAGWSAAAALLACVTVLGGVAVHERSEIDAMHREHGAMTSLLAAGDVHTEVGRVATGGVVTIASSRSRNMMVVTASGLSAPPSGMTYQLWMKKSGVMRPGPLVRPGGRGGVSQLMTHGVDGTSAVTMTVEPARGSSHPTGSQVLMVPLTS
jgi:hypothetical protein